MAFFDDDLFADELRRRIRTLLNMKNMSMAKVSKSSGAGESSLKEFMNGRTQSPRVQTLIRWARVLDTPPGVLIDGIGEMYVGFEPNAEKHMVDETRPDEIELRLNSAKNLRFLRGMLGETAETFASATGCYKDGVPDIDLYADFEAGRKMIPPMIAIHLAREFGFTVEDIYSLYGAKIGS